MSVYRTTIFLLTAGSLYLAVENPEATTQIVSQFLARHPHTLPQANASYLPEGAQPSATISGQQSCRAEMTAMPRRPSYQNRPQGESAQLLSDEIFALTNKLHTIYCLARYEADYGKLEAVIYGGIVQTSTVISNWRDRIAILAGRPQYASTYRGPEVMEQFPSQPAAPSPEIDVEGLAPNSVKLMGASNLPASELAPEPEAVLAPPAASPGFDPASPVGADVVPPLYPHAATLREAPATRASSGGF